MTPPVSPGVLQQLRRDVVPEGNDPVLTVTGRLLLGASNTPPQVSSGRSQTIVSPAQLVLL